MPFIYVDRALTLTRSQRIVAVRQLSFGEEIFHQHFPGNPMLPASLLMEAVAQAATVLLEASDEFQRKAFVGYIEKAKFRRPVRPGHELRLELEVKQAGDDGALLRGVALQQERKCATVDIGMVKAPMGAFFKPHQLHYYLDLYRQMLAETEFEGFERHPLEALDDGKT